MNKKTLWFISLFFLVVVCVLVPLFIAKKNKEKHVMIPHVGQIQVLNACSINGAAGQVGAFLRSKGFDVVDLANNDEWYFNNTIVVCRNGNMNIAKQIATALNTDKVMLLRKEGALLDATVFVGKNYKKLIKKL